MKEVVVGENGGIRLIAVVVVVVSRGCGSGERGGWWVRTAE